MSATATNTIRIKKRISELSSWDRATLVKYKEAVRDAHKNLQGEDLDKCLKALKNYMRTYNRGIPMYVLNGE